MQFHMVHCVKVHQTPPPSLHLSIVGDTSNQRILATRLSSLRLSHLEDILRLISSLPNDGSLPRALHRSKLVDRERGAHGSGSYDIMRRYRISKLLVGAFHMML